MIAAYLTAAVFLVVAALAIVWLFLRMRDPLRRLDDYEALARRCARADGCDFEIEDVRRAKPSH